MDDVPIKLGSASFQSKLVRGAQYSEILFYGPVIVVAIAGLFGGKVEV